LAEETGRYKTPGELVKTAREERDLSLEHLAAATRIPLRSLQSLEKDDFESLAGPLYIRSFLKSLAPELGLDPELLLERYKGLVASDPVQDTIDDQGPTWETETRVLKVQGPPWRGALIGVSAIVVVILIGVLIRGSQSGESQTGRPESSPAVTVEATLSAGDSLLAPIRDQDDPGALLETAAPPRIDGAQSSSGFPEGSPELVFAGGRRWPLVLRLVMDHALELDVQPDGRSFALDRDHAAPGVPSEDIVPGRLYRVGSKMILYFGAAEHFDLILASRQGIAVSLNGRALEIPAGAVGSVWQLDQGLLDRKRP